MNDAQYRFFSARRLPLRLTAQQAAWELNCQEHDIPILIAAKLLKPLGSPPRNGVKFFGRKLILEHGEDHAWLIRITNAIHDYWKKHNAAKKKNVLQPQ